MSAGWVAAAARGRALARRRIGRDGVVDLAACPSLPVALATLASTAYGRGLSADLELGAAQQEISAVYLWHLRVLAGWCPPLGAGPLQLLAARFEIENVAGHLARLRGDEAPVPYSLGSLATSWPAVATARTPGEVRARLAASAWGDPGSEEPALIRLALEFAWSRRLLDGLRVAEEWAVASAALTLAKIFAAGARDALGPSMLRDVDHVLGTRWRRAIALGDLHRNLPPAGAGLLAGVECADDLFRAEVAYWELLEAGARALAHGSQLSAAVPVGVAGLLAADAWWTRAALVSAARGGWGIAEVLDAVA